MRDARVQAAQEPQNELRELLDDSWGRLGFAGIAVRLAGVFAVSALVAWFFVDNYDTYNELVDLPAARTFTFAGLFGGACALASAFRLLGEWKYIAARLTDKQLYFEETGWADGFRLQKPEDTAFRDLILRDDEVLPRLAIVQDAFNATLVVALAAIAAFVVSWVIL